MQIQDYAFLLVLITWELKLADTPGLSQQAQRLCLNVETTLKNSKLMLKQKKVSYEICFNIIIST